MAAIVWTIKIIFLLPETCSLIILINRYHIKYKHIGDLKKDEIEKVVTSLHPQLRMRLRFLVHSLTVPTTTGVDQPHSVVVAPTSLTSTTPTTTSEAMDTHHNCIHNCIHDCIFFINHNDGKN